MDRLRYEEEEVAYYDSKLLPQDFQESFDRCVITGVNRVFKYQKELFVNLYVRHGQQKVIDFMNLFAIDDEAFVLHDNGTPTHEKKLRGAVRECMRAVVENYVFYFKQCDFMAEGEWFEKCLERIKNEKDIAKLNCLASLLSASAYSRHDLQHTLDAFDFFWDEIKKLGPDEKQLASIRFTNMVNGKLLIAAVPPGVAMERFLTILKNARDISSQIDYLNDLPSGGFKTYYASEYEGFGMVHQDMDISWTPNSYNMHALTEWPSNLSYFKNSFVLLNEELFYITSDLQRVSTPFTDRKNKALQQGLFEAMGKTDIDRLKRKKFIQLPRESLSYITDYQPDPVAYNQHAKVYQVDLSTLRDMALKEDVIHYPTFYAWLHRYMGQQKTGISYADFREQTKECNFQQQDKESAFILLFFMTDSQYDEALGIRSLIDELKKLEPEVRNQLAEILYNLAERGIIFNNKDGLTILKDLSRKNPQVVLNELKNRTLVITEYDVLFQRFATIAPEIKKKLKEQGININEVPLILNTLQQFSKHHQKILFKALQPELKNDIGALCAHITALRVAALPPEYISHYVRLNELSCDVVLERFSKDPHDPVLSYILSKDFKGSGIDAAKLLDLTATSTNKYQVVALLKKHQEILHYISDPIVLDIIAKSHSTLLPKEHLSREQWQELATKLSSLEHRDVLIELYQVAAPNSVCLLNALKNNDLTALERTPFGARDDQRHFDVSEVERVVNECRDWSNGNDSPYRYQYRKQLMEAFTFVNEVGYKLPIFDGKTAKELSNVEIQDYFKKLKGDKSFLQDLTPFQRKLIALSLIREALYRSTGQMAYSTQMIAIIDCLMHEGHLISNIDTGQGKSLIDMAKAALLWLDSDRVDITTSSVADAKRDLANFSPFLSFLKIPHGKKPLTTQSEHADFVADGINVSTFAQLSLFQAKMKMTDKPLGKEEDRVSLIVNESDYSLLEDRTVYRYASQSNESLSQQNEWIYTAINDFVKNSPEFTANTTSAQRDVLNLKKFLRNYAKEHKKNAKIISEIGEEQWLKWIDAALLVQYKLKENEDFIIPEELQAVTIRGKTEMSHVAKVLMAEGEVKTKISPDAKFGNGVQQLLYAKLNKDYPDRRFVIEPETQTILSANNRNLIEYYLKRKNTGFIWGSSGTAGSLAEREELHKKYNIDFSKIAPHQKKIIKQHDMELFHGQKAQFEAIKRKMQGVKADPEARPQLIFCKDIDSAKRLYELLKKEHPDNLQIYTGGDDETKYVANAAKGGMITICTAAIGRNTDILYNRAIGMNVMHTSVNSYNLEAQLTGRTGRQGSGGDIEFCFNHEELGGRDPKEIQKEIYQNSLKNRAFNEELYSILGNVLVQIEQQALQRGTINSLNNTEEEKAAKPFDTIDFLNNTWSKLSVKYEKLYKELKMSGQYDQDQFINTIVNELGAFNLDRQKISDAITHQFEAKESYNPYMSDVTLNDCVPPIALAYTLLNNNQAEPLDEAAKKEIEDETNKLLNNCENGVDTEHHATYIRFLIQSKASQDDIRAIHQKCINGFLEQQVGKAPSWYQQMLGHQSALSQVSNSSSYLLLFRALSSVPGASFDTATEFAAVQRAAIALMKEYQGMWFINGAHKQMAKDLIEQLENAKDLPAMITLLDDYQVQVAQKDIEANQSRWFHLHRSGSSRLQNTISSALNLSTSLHGKNTTRYKGLLEKLQDADKNNKKVITQQIETAIKHRGHSGDSPDDKNDLDDTLHGIRPSR